MNTYRHQPVKQWLSTLAEWTGVAVVGSLYAAGYVTIGWFAFVLWLGHRIGAIIFPRWARRAPTGYVDPSTVEWDPAELAAVAPVSGDLTAGGAW